MIQKISLLILLLISIALIKSSQSSVSVEWYYGTKSNSTASVHLGSTIHLICQIMLSTPGKFDQLMMTYGEPCMSNATNVLTCMGGTVFFSYARTTVPSGAYQNAASNYAVFTSMDSTGTENVYTVLTIPNITPVDFTSYHCNYYSSADRTLVTSSFKLTQAITLNAGNGGGGGKSKKFGYNSSAGHRNAKLSNYSLLFTLIMLITCWLFT